MARRPKKDDKVIVGGCTCNFWSANNCAYVKARGLCQERAILRHAQEQRTRRETEALPEPPPADGDRN